MGSLEAYRDYLEEYCNFYKQFARLEKDKLGLFQSQQYFNIDGFVKSEEAMVLRAQGMEQKRVQMQRELGIPAETLQALVAYLDGNPLQQDFQRIFSTLSDLVMEVKGYNEKSQSIAKEKLKEIASQEQQMTEKQRHQVATKSLMNQSI